jgi:glycosyltransferase involved in cell wall biosynthesis
MNVPVICSNVTSLPETISDSKYLFDPNDINEIKSKIRSIYYNEDFRKNALLHIKFIREKLLKSKSLDQIKLVYSELLQNPKKNEME